jgi:probable F420-dependent oxidoreductase
MAIRDFVQAVEGLGYDYILIYESLIGAQSDQPPEGWHEPFTLLSFMAGITRRLEFATGIVVLPSRQTALVAKQAAELDLLTGGRLRLGVAVGASEAEYQAMGIAFRERGPRIEEQIAVLRRLWTEPFVTFHGTYHHLEGAGIYPRPVQQPIPIWIGGGADPVLKRVANFGDGWMMYDETPESAPEKLDKLRRYIAEAGRQPDDVALNIVGIEIGEDADWGKLVEDWSNLGVTYLDVSTWKSGFTTWDQHINAIRRFKQAVSR